MKKSLLVLTAAFLGAGICANAQVQRINLFEEWTGENCSPCAATNPGITALADANYAGPKKLVLLRYQVAIPSAPSSSTSLYQQNSTEPPARQNYYYPNAGDQFAPQGRLNGHELGRGATDGSNGHAGYLAQDSIDLEYQVDAPFDLQTSFMWNATEDSITITTSITAAQNFSTTNPLKLQLAIIEEHIHYATPPGSNGEKDFEFVMRKMVPDENGQTLTGTWTNGQNQVLTNKVKLPTYIWNKGEVAIVAFIQEDMPSPGPTTTMNVHQAGYGMPQALNIDANAFAITGLGAYTCTDNINPVFELKNSGNNALTSCDINYQLDAGTINTINWTGSLATGASDMVNIPTITTTSGSHTLTITVTNVNGSTDSNPANNDKGITFENINVTPVFPLSEGFETSFPLAGWGIINPDADVTWVRTTNAAKTGVASVFMDNANYSSNGQIDEFRLPPLDLSGTTNPALTFQVAYTMWTNPASNPNYSDTLDVFGSTDCGATWVNLYRKYGVALTTTTNHYQASDFIPTASQWRLETIDLTSYAGSGSFLVKFRNTTDYENDMYIDDININDASSGLNSKSAVSAINLYPNPASTKATLQIESINSDKALVSVYNSIGQVISNFEVNINAGNNSIDINTAEFANGLYTVNVVTANGKVAQKLTVNH